jgi:hypothetical protein
MDHSHNVDILQLPHRVSQAAEVLQIFTYNSEIDRGHHWLNLQNVEGVYHTNPRSWTGDVTVNSVSLLSAWSTGQRKAQQLLQPHNIPFQEFSALPANVDLLRPFGDFLAFVKTMMMENESLVLVLQPKPISPCLHQPSPLYLR